MIMGHSAAFVGVGWHACCIFSLFFFSFFCLQSGLLSFDSLFMHVIFPGTLCVVVSVFQSRFR